MPHVRGCRGFPATIGEAVSGAAKALASASEARPDAECRIRLYEKWELATIGEALPASPGFYRITLFPYRADQPLITRHWRQIYQRCEVLALPGLERVKAYRVRLLAWLSLPPQVEALALLLTGEKLLNGYAFRPAKRDRKRAIRELVSPSGYYEDGSMRCPYEDIRGEAPCGWHTYSGCSDDFEDTAEARRS